MINLFLEAIKGSGSKICGLKVYGHGCGGYIFMNDIFSFKYILEKLLLKKGIEPTDKTLTLSVTGTRIIIHQWKGAEEFSAEIDVTNLLKELIDEGAVIKLYGCDTDDLAQKISKALGNDISVTGCDGLMLGDPTLITDRYGFGLVVGWLTEYINGLKK